MGTQTKYKRFAKALATWLRTSSGLATLTAYNATTNTSIFITDGQDEIAPPKMAAVVLHAPQVHPNIDTLYSTNVICECFSLNKLETEDMAGALIELAKQSASTGKDAVFNTDNIRTSGIRITGTPQIGEHVTEDPGSIFISSVTLTIVWVDTAT